MCRQKTTLSLMTVGWQFEVVNKDILSTVVSSNEGNCTVFPEETRLQDYISEPQRLIIVKLRIESAGESGDKDYSWN